MAKPFSKCTIRNKEFLSFLSHAVKSKNNSKVKALIDNASADQLNSILEIIKNTLKGNISYSVKDKRKLVKHSDSIRRLSKPGLSNQVKKKIIQQKGGFIPALLTPVLAALATELIHKYL